MSSIFDPDIKRTILERIGRLNATSPANWGEMSVDEMLCHCADGFRLAIGERPVEDKSNIFTRSVVKFAILNFARMPKNVPTSPELDQRKSGTPSQGFDRSVADLLAEIERSDARSENANWGTHAIFGPLTKQEWGKLGFRHLDHHLRQFGV